MSDSSQVQIVVCVYGQLDEMWWVREVLWNHRTSTAHRSKTNDIAETLVPRVKKNVSGIAESVGQILQNTIAICEMSKSIDLLTDGKKKKKLILKDGLDSISRDQ